MISAFTIRQEKQVPNDDDIPSLTGRVIAYSNNDDDAGELHVALLKVSDVTLYTGVIAFGEYGDWTVRIRVTLSELSTFAKALLDVVLIANGNDELTPLEHPKAKIDFGDTATLTMQLVYTTERDYGEIQTDEQGRQWCYLDEYDEPAWLDVTATRLGDSAATRLNLDDANALHTNLTGLMFGHARIMS